MGHLRRSNPASKSIKGRCCPKADKLVRRGERSNVPCMDDARGARKKLDISAKRSGAAMYSAFECGRFGRWP
jgi:hypothetical protein